MTGATIRLDERDYAELKGEAAPAGERGHWRVIMWLSPAVGRATQHFPPSVIARFHGDEWMWLRRHATEAEANEHGRMHQRYADDHGVGHVFVFRRAEFFPDYSGGAS